MSKVKKVKVSHSLIAIGAVGVESHFILGTADERWNSSFSFRCLMDLSLFKKVNLLKFFKSLYFLNHLMNLVHIWTNDRYRSKVYISNTFFSNI